jgi:membrane protease YdiL (CAAX protease family)
MTTPTPSPIPAPSPPSLGQRVLAWPLVRIVLAFLMMAVPVALVLVVVQRTLPRELRQVWPQLLCTALCVGAYIVYVRKVERRRVDELARAGAPAELAAGAALGALMFATVVGLLFVSGAFTLTGSNGASALFKPLAEMELVACIEELVFRGVLFRIAAKSLGAWPALLISSALFAAAHLPNEHISAIGVINTALAGLMFGAAYLASGRLWLPIGIHFAWNMMSDGVFSLPTSGHPGRGLLQLQTGGPEWLSGGAYGVEASLVTLMLLATVCTGLLAVAARAGRLDSRAAPSAAASAASA